MSNAADSLPTHMQALQLAAYDGRLKLVELPVPQPPEGHVLVEVAAAPVHPSDLMFMVGRYGIKKPLPTVPGFEGSGVVVRSGGGEAANALVGRRVAVASASGDGTWARYTVVPAGLCFPLLDGTSMDAGAMLVVNPLTAYCLVEEARARGAAAVVQTAAASALGRMVVARCRQLDLPLINVVRRQEQVELLLGLGAQEVLSTHQPDFDRVFSQRARALNATVALDAVGGATAGRILRGLPRHSSLILYGSLSDEPCQFNPGDLIFAGKTMRGFWLSDLLKAEGLQRLQQGAAVVQPELASHYSTQVRARVTLDQAVDALAAYAADMTAGKVLLMPR